MTAANHNNNNSVEIWATRIQQELLALTTEEEENQSLPNYCTLLPHALDLDQATVVVPARLDVNNTVVEIALDASFRVTNYPFQSPIVEVRSGSQHLGAHWKDGDRLTVDLDWTPSLQLVNVLLHVSLKIKESILQGEPIPPYHPESSNNSDPMMDEMNELAKGARKFASKLGERASNISKALTPKHNMKALPPRKKKNIDSSNVAIGDEINWLEEPWSNAHGVYSCKAIRRPTFVQTQMTKSQDVSSQMTSPTQMFRNFAKNARSVMEESFLMVTESHIIELKGNKLNLQNIGTVVFCIPIYQLAKLKFRRQESVSLFFKNAVEDPLVYLCPDAGDAVHQIQTVLKKHGVRGKHTNASAYRAINEAMLMVQDIQTKEFAVSHDPSVERVNEIMDLYRQAAEKFESAGDIRHEEVITHMKQFLAKPSTIAVLDGSFQKQEKFIPQGEVLERSMESTAVSDDDDEEEEAAAPASSDDNFVDSIDTLLKDAKEDFGNFHLDDDDEEALANATNTNNDDDDLAGMAADLDEMMKEADKELAELMGS